MKRLNTAVMKMGDIALTTSDSVVGKKVRLVTASPISHAMLYVTVSSIVHAIGEGVRAENTQGIFFEDDAPVLVRRLKGGLPAPVAEGICDHVRERVGTQYGYVEAAKSGFGGGTKTSTRQFCSRLVAQAYRKFGYNIVGDADFCTPAGLLDSELLEDVIGCTATVPDGEFRFWQDERLSPVDHSMEALTTVLKAIRTIDPSVQAFQDIGRFVMVRREYDEAVDALLHSSGFVGSWRHDLEDHPWRFDKALIERMEGIEAYCAVTMMGEPRDDNRFTRSLAGIRSDYGRCRRETLKSLMSLYERLADLHAKRIDAAAFWLKKNRDVSS